MPDKLCPMRKATYPEKVQDLKSWWPWLFNRFGFHKTGGQIEDFMPCLGMECAWWREGWCAILSLTNALEIMSNGVGRS